MTGKVLNEYKQKINSYKLVPSGGGRFEFAINGEVVYSKLETGEFPIETAILDVVRSRLRK